MMVPSRGPMVMQSASQSCTPSNRKPRCPDRLGPYYYYHTTQVNTAPKRNCGEASGPAFLLSNGSRLNHSPQSSDTPNGIGPCGVIIGTWGALAISAFPAFLIHTLDRHNLGHALPNTPLSGWETVVRAWIFSAEDATQRRVRVRGWMKWRNRVRKNGLNNVNGQWYHPRKVL